MHDNCGALINAASHPKTQERMLGFCFVSFLYLPPSPLPPHPLSFWGSGLVFHLRCFHLSSAGGREVQERWAPVLLALKFLTYINFPLSYLFVFRYRLLSLNFYTCYFPLFLFRVYLFFPERLSFIKEFFFQPCWCFGFSCCAGHGTQGLHIAVNYSPSELYQPSVDHLTWANTVFSWLTIP